MLDAKYQENLVVLESAKRALRDAIESVRRQREESTR
jgi:hypothetical protein